MDGLLQGCFFESNYLHFMLLLYINKSQQQENCPAMYLCCFKVLLDVLEVLVLSLSTLAQQLSRHVATLAPAVKCSTYQLHMC